MLSHFFIFIKFVCISFLFLQIQRALFNMVVSNHFHSVKNPLFTSAKPRDFDGMLGTGLPMSMHTTKTPIDMWRFNVPQLKEFLKFSVKDRYQLNYLYQRLL